MKIQDRVTPIYNRLFETKRSGELFYNQHINPADKVKIVDTARKYKLLLFELDKFNFFWTWIGDRKWYKSVMPGKPYVKESVTKAVVDFIIQSTNYMGGHINILNPTGEIKISRLGDTYEIDNLGLASNRLFQLLKL